MERVFFKCTILGCNKLASFGRFMSTSKCGQKVGGILFLPQVRSFVVYCDIGFCLLAKQKKGEGIRTEPNYPKGES